MTTPAEAYAKLKAPKATAPTELCKCTGTSPIKVVLEPGFNPLRCVACGKEVAPESLKLSAEHAEAAAGWQAPADGIYRLWLAAGEYQSWAERQLTDISSPINVDGRKLADELNATRRCYYAWNIGDEPLGACPRCGGAVAPVASTAGPQAACDDCSIIGLGAGA